MPGRITTSAIAMVAMLVFVCIRLRDSRIGRAWMAIREDEIAAGAMGVNRTKFKLLAFAIGAAFGGMTGVFYVAKLQTATPEMFGFPVSVMILVMVVFGGIGSVWGVVLGALHPAAAAVVVAAGPVRMAARIGAPDRQQPVAAHRPGAVDRADLRPDPGLHDAVPARGADTGDTSRRRR